MNFSWDAFGGVTQVIGIIYLYYQFNYLPRKEKKNSVLRIQTLWITSKTKLEWLIDNITLYIKVENCLNDPFMQEVTFKSQLMQLHHILDSEFTEDAYKQIAVLAESNFILPSMLENINRQLVAFTELEAYFKTTYFYKLDLNKLKNFTSNA